VSQDHPGRLAAGPELKQGLEGLKVGFRGILGSPDKKECVRSQM
jgi:hypothetical protein